MRWNRSIMIVLALSLPLAHARAQHHTAPIDDERPSPPASVQEQRAAMLEDANRTMKLRRSDAATIRVPPLPEPAMTAQLTLDGRALTLNLEPHSVRAPNFRIRAAQADGSLVDVPIPPSQTVRGVIPELPGATIAGSVSEEGLTALIMMPDGTRTWVEPLVGKSRWAGPLDHIVYRDDDLIDQGKLCGALPHLAPPLRPEDDNDRGGIIITNCGDAVCIAVTAIDCDFEFMAFHGGPVGATLQVERVINTVNFQYEPEVSIRHEIGDVIVRTSPTYSTIDPEGLLVQFRNLWNAQHQDIPRAVAHLFTGKEIAGNVIGIAYLSAICTEVGYGLSQSDCCGSFAFATDLTSHELGHNWGSGHCNCIGWTMHPFIQGANRFHPVFTIPVIREFRDTRTCLGGGGVTRIRLPMFDNFEESTSFNRLIWSVVEGAQINTKGLNEPSGQYSMNLNGSDFVDTVRFDTSFDTAVTLSYWYQSRGLADPPELGDNLVISYLDSAGQWLELQTHYGGGPTMPGYAQNTIHLGPDAEHQNFQVRFRSTSPTPGLDDWFVDDVSITSQPALPGPFSLGQPADNALGLPFPITFSWSAAFRATNYRLQIDDDPNFSSPIVSLFTANATMWNISANAGLIPGERYYWRIHAINVNGETLNQGGPRSFVAEVGMPGVFVLFEPTSGLPIETTTPTYRWSRSEGAQMYHLHVADNFNFTNPVENRLLFATPGTADEQYTPLPGILQNDTTYYWKMSAINQVGSTPAITGIASFATAVPIPPDDPIPCPADVDASGAIDLDDIAYIVLRLGNTDGDGDADGSGIVDLDDISFIVLRFGPCED